MTDRYYIVRFRFNGPTRKVRGMGGLTLEQAQAHCSRSDTHARGICQLCHRQQTRAEWIRGERACPVCGVSVARAWFDGYDKE